MRLIERGEQEEHFSEGEPDLEPPEELCLSEVDEDAQLEEELDNEDILEDDVDDDLLAATLEELVHNGDDDEEHDGAPSAASDPLDDDDDIEEEPDLLDIEDVEESLDRILQVKLALLDGADAAELEDGLEDGLDGDGTLADVVVLHSTRRHPSNGHSGAFDATVLAHRPDEFVCRGCFLVCNSVQLADGAAMLCHDCAE